MQLSTGQALPAGLWGHPTPAAAAAGDPAADRVARRMRAADRSLRAQLLMQLGFLASSAVLVTGFATWLVARYGDDASFERALLALWLASTTLFLLIGTYLIQRLVLRPVARLAAEADALAAGDFARVETPYETDEFSHLAGRYRHMAASLLDTHSQMVRVEKLAGIGQLAAGVAHEIRNPLGALHTYVELLERRAARGAGPDAVVLTGMRREVERVELTVRSLLDYARPGASVAAMAEPHSEVNDAVEHVLTFLEAQGALKGLTVTRDLAPVVPPVPLARHALEQVLVNLVLNARDAAPDGRVIVGTRPDHYDPDAQVRARVAHEAVPRRQWLPRPRRPDLAPHTPGVLLFVADAGPGVPEALRERVFDPFYTTKDPGQGSGLGLAIVAQTVHAAGGLVWVDPAREGGAVFKVFLPAAVEA
ncbi:MAG: HAMP domain-containing histidine kinase [Gemmatimonadales bacterium]|jgi:signal transduction histidine kinase|nr:HAMP domain-containing histidine kinase [Gemmatimonadales bacterium]